MPSTPRTPARPSPVSVLTMRRLICVTAAALLLVAAPAAPDAKQTRKVDFTREVRPILSRCFQCHGPDEKARKAKLRLDTRQGAIASAVVPGKPEKSELIARITTSDDTQVMPPTKAGKRLSAAEVSV